MRVYSAVAEHDNHKFFKVDINGNEKFLHKQTAAWLITKKSNHLSSDRLLRVQQTAKQSLKYVLIHLDHMHYVDVNEKSYID